MTKAYYVFWILFTVLFFILFEKADGQAGRCYGPDGIYRHGETTVIREGNSIRFTCVCLVTSSGRIQTNCTRFKKNAHVLIADGNKITKVALGGGYGFEISYIKNLKGSAVSVDVDQESDMIFWTDVSNKRRGIYRARYSDGRPVIRIVSDDVYEPNGIAVDWLSKNIYWTDAQLGAIFVARNDGTMRTQLISGLPEPRCIVVLPREGIMFWSDQTAGTIESARMDGSGRRVVMAGLAWPNQIAVNRLSRRIYWIDAYKRTIASCKFDGSGYSHILDYSYTKYNSPGYGLSLFEDNLYFGLWNESSHQSSMFSITNIGQHFKSIVNTLSRKPMGMTIINAEVQRHERYTNLCWSQGSGVCSHLCLPTSYNLHRCACPSNTGLVLSRDGRTCIIPDDFLLYTSIDEGTVMMVSAENGADKVPSLFAQSHQPSAVAFDPVDRVVYWSDVAMNAIYRKKLGDLQAAVFIQDGIGTVDGLSVDYTNRHLYFTNMGWHGTESPFHQIEMVSLNDAGERKILNSTLLNKPRDILIDQENGILYISDWGKDAKIIRSDLDGQGQVALPIKVENPNGIALDGYDLYVVDSHVNSALVNGNGTVVYGQAPTFVLYNTEFESSREINGITMEVPFGLTHGPSHKLYMTDWGFGGIYEIDPDRGRTKDLIIGIQKPTGITYASLKYRKYDNECTRGSRQCSDICVSIASIDLVCMCPDRSATALSNVYNCVEPDSFMLVADQTQIVMKSFDPDDYQQYVIVRTYDMLSNIVAVTYDPETNFVYWADNGRLRIARKNLRDKKAGPNNYETVYTNIGRVEGLAMDPEHRLLFWTDAEKGTIEMLSLSNYIQHTTIHTRLSHPRAIVLHPENGMLYWTEEGDHPMVFASTMSGQDRRRLVGSSLLKSPNGLYLDKESDRLWIADGGTLQIMAVLTVGSFYSDASILDQKNETGFADHIFGLWRDPTSHGSSLIYTDWVKRAVIKGTEVYMDNLVRPSQIFLKQPYGKPAVTDVCSTGAQQCSHICVPSPTSYICLCPDDLLLADDRHTCLTKEQVFLLTSTTEATTTTTIATTTTVPWAEIITTTTTTSFETTTMEKTAVMSATSIITTANNVTTSKSWTPTTFQHSTTAEMQTEETTLPADPYFSKCDETNTYEIPLSADDPVVNVTASLLGLEAFDGRGRPLDVIILDDFNETLQFVLVSIQNMTVYFRATDSFGITIRCDIQLAVTDHTPPHLLYCPNDMELETYAESGDAFASWKTPEFVDNSGIKPVVLASYEPGMFSIGLYNVTYRADDDSGNSAYCVFQVAILQKESPCHIPHAPRNSKLTCSVINGVQKCLITCDKHYRLSLADPYITCQEKVDGNQYAWIPFLNSGICSRPLVANVQQNILLHYPCPCRPDVQYYHRTRNSFSKAIKSYSNCENMEHRLGFCNRRKGGKLHFDCIDFENLNVTVTVDLDNLRGVRDTKQVRDIVKRSANTIIEKATEGQIVVQGYAERKNYTANAAALTVSQPKVICEIGFIAAAGEGCIQCPKGTFAENNKCEFCPQHHYQDEAGRDHCIECPKEKGTTIHGATDKSYCKLMQRVVDESLPPIGLIVASAVGSVIAASAFIFVIICIRRRKKNNKFKKEQERLKREQEERRRRRSLRKQNKSNTDGKNTRGKGERSKTRSQNNTYSAMAVSKTNSPNNSSKNSAPAKVKTEPNNTQRSDKTTAKDVKDVTLKPAIKFQDEADANQPKSAEENNKPDTTEGALFVDLASDTASAISTDPPLKSALKKRRNPPPVESYDDEDNSTVISASTITSAQLRRANIKPRASSWDRDPQSSLLKKGSVGRRSMSMRKNTASPLNLRNDGPSSLPKGHRRTVSFSHEESGAHHMFPPRLLSPHQPNMMVRMPQTVLGMRPPLAPPHNFPMGAPRPVGPSQIYGSYAPRRMPPPGGPVIFGPSSSPRQPMMAGTIPGHQQGPGYKTGFWNEGYDNGPEWEQMQMRNGPDIRQPARMMALPRAAMVQRYRMPISGMANIRGFPPRMQPPPPYFA